MYPTLYGVWVYVTGELFEHVRTWRGTFRTEGVFQKFFSAGRKVLLPVPVLVFPNELPDSERSVSRPYAFVACATVDGVEWAARISHFASY